MTFTGPPSTGSPGRRRQFSAAALIGGIVWIIALAAGFLLLWRYAYEPGRAADAKREWPAASRVARDPHRPTLVLLLSPGCPCSQATLAELARLLARAPDRAAIRAIVDDSHSHAGDMPAGKTQIEKTPIAETRLWQTLQTLPGVDAIIDRDGREAAAFGAYVSGQTFLYDAAGRLQFSGGLTAARGHEGDNDGVDAVVAMLTGGRVPIDRTPVYGCVLEGASPP